MLNQKLLFRSAAAIHEQLNKQATAATSLKLPIGTWERCAKLTSQLHRAMEYDWTRSAVSVKGDLERMLVQLQNELTFFKAQLEPLDDETPHPTLRDVFDDLVALQEEFEEVAFDRNAGTLSVTTESIELEGVYLGPFEIELTWKNQGYRHSPSYRVIAMDEHPAKSNDNVSHPHVQDEILCEGDGRRPIDKALKQGRLFDFFTIVANLLRTYNDGSPYVSLADWNGTDCADCGSSTDSDDLWRCEKCNTKICGDCYTNCCSCSGIYCGECATRCEGCGERSCRTCLSVCNGCLTELCKNCLPDNGKCSACYEKEQECKSADAATDEDPLHVVQPNGLGQTVVPA